MKSSLLLLMLLPFLVIVAQPSFNFPDSILSFPFPDSLKDFHLEHDSLDIPDFFVREEHKLKMPTYQPGEDIHFFMPKAIQDSSISYNMPEKKFPELLVPNRDKYKWKNKIWPKK